jgi:linoleoyl-CoA desaturase
MQEVKVKFNNRKSATFAAALRANVNQYFTDNNISTYANRAMVIKTIVLLTMSFGPYFLIMFGDFTPWQMFGLVCISGFCLAGVGFSVSHDALHGAYSENPKINKLLGLTFPIIGVSDYFWKIKHNVMHHTYTNIYEKDEDLSVTKFLRMTPVAPFKPIHRIQHVLAFFAYTLLSIGWVFGFRFQEDFRIQRHAS